MKSGHPALDPLVITRNGVLSVKDDVLKSPQQLCTLLHGHRYIDDCENIIPGTYGRVLSLSTSPQH